MSLDTGMLGVATALLFAAVLVPRAYPRWPGWMRLVWRVAAFAAVTVLVQQLLGSPARPQFRSAETFQHVWERLVDAGWWLLAGRVAVSLARLLIVLENQPREVKILADLLVGAIYIAALLAIVAVAFSVPIQGLLATSGVLAIVLGLALQSTLSDVFSGIAVGLERPYQPGDVLWVEGGIEGHVLQVNWRSTQIATGDGNVAIIPNSVIAKARLVNRSAPTPVRSDSIDVKVAAGITPEFCMATLTAAARACGLLLAAPAPTVYCTAVQGDGTVFKVNFSVASSRDLEAGRTELLTRVHRHLRFAGMALAVPTTATPPMAAVPTPAQVLEQSDLFGIMDPSQRAVLAEHFTLVRLQADEMLIRQGEIPDALFVISSGAVVVTVDEPAGPKIVHRISPGESLGAASLITNAAHAATAAASTPVEAYRLNKAGLAAAIAAEPALSACLEVVAERSLSAMRADATLQLDRRSDSPEIFLARLRSFLQSLDV